jgi:hypothetical protein
MHRQQQRLPAKARAPIVELALGSPQTRPASIFEPFPICYSSPGPGCARILQQTETAIYEIDHTRIDNAVEDIVPIAPGLNDPTIRKALELVTHGLRFHSERRCQAAWIDLTFL